MSFNRWLENKKKEEYKKKKLESNKFLDNCNAFGQIDVKQNKKPFLYNITYE